MFRRFLLTVASYCLLACAGVNALAQSPEQSTEQSTEQTEATTTAPPASNYLTSVWASSTTDVWAVSVSAATANIWHLDSGGTWTDVSGGTLTAFASKIRGGGAGVYVWAQGRIAKWNGAGWTHVNAGTGSCPSSPTSTMWVSATEVRVGGYFGALGRLTP